MINRSIYAIILGLAVVTSGHTAEPTSKSVSVNLKIKNTNPGIFHCSGSVDYPELFKWEISASDLKEGVGCGQGDFDGNGTLDFFSVQVRGFQK